MFGKNRKQRLELFKQLKTATRNTRTARLSWNVQESQQAQDRTVTASTAGFEAVKMVRELMSQYIWPTAPKLAYTGMRRTSVRLDQEEVDAGVITVSGELRSPLGVDVAFDVPVEIRAGRLLEPSIMVFGGHPRVISQSTIDTVVRDNNTYMDTPVRPIYGAPLDKNEAAVRKPFHQERRSPGLFAVAGKQAALREFVRTKGMKGTAQLESVSGVEEWEKNQLEGIGGQPLYQPNTRKPAPIPLTEAHPTDPMHHDVVEHNDQTTPPIGLPPSPGTATMPSMGQGACRVCGQPAMDEKYAPYWCSEQHFRYDQQRGQRTKQKHQGPKDKASSKDEVLDEENARDEEYERDEQEPSLDETWQGEQESMERESASKPSKSKPASKSKGTSKEAGIFDSFKKKPQVGGGGAAEEELTKQLAPDCYEVLKRHWDGEMDSTAALSEIKTICAQGNGSWPNVEKYLRAHAPELEAAWKEKHKTVNMFTGEPTDKKPGELIPMKAHMNAEEKKTVLYEGSKNPEPVPSNPAMGEDIDEHQPNVEDDEERKQAFMPGQSVKLKKKLSAPTRGGGRVIFNSGAAGTVIRDQAGDGYAVYVMFNDGRHALVPGKYL
jgi:hypothetical protein